MAFFIDSHIYVDKSERLIYMIPVTAKKRKRPFELGIEDECPNTAREQAHQNP